MLLERLLRHHRPIVIYAILHLWCHTISRASRGCVVSAWTGRGGSLVAPLSSSLLFVKQRALHKRQFTETRQLSIFARSTPLTMAAPPAAMADSGATRTSMTPVPSLPEFLYHIRPDNHVYRKEPRHVVIGNPAGDADSIVSAITLAYIESAAYFNTTTNNNDSDTTTRSHHDDALKPLYFKTPVVSIPHSDLVTQRPETVCLWKWAGLTHDDLLHLLYMDHPIFTSVVALDKNHTLERDDNDIDDQPSELTIADVTLVDHNALALPHDWKVIEILDHHFDMGQHLDTCPEDAATHQRTIAFDNHESRALVASTCTLVVERMRAMAWPLPYAATVSLLLLGVILLDSVDMAPSAGKGTARDQAAIDWLLHHTDWSTLSESTQSQIMNDNKDDDTTCPTINTTRLFQGLQQAKFDPVFWHGLSVRDALRLDYKAFGVIPSGSDDSQRHTTFGLSTVLMPLHAFSSKDMVHTHIHAFMDEHAIDLLGVLLAFTSSDEEEDGGRLRRQIMLCGRATFADLDPLVHFLQQGDHVGDPLHVQVMEPTEASTVRQLTTQIEQESLTTKCLEQRNSKASRKQVAPILLSYMAKVHIANVD
jgi:exopolyphosphatase